MSQYKIGDWLKVPNKHTLIIKYLGGTILPTVNVSLINAKKSSEYVLYFSLQPRKISLTRFYKGIVYNLNVLGEAPVKGDTFFLHVEPLISYYRVDVSMKRYNESKPTNVLVALTADKFTPPDLYYKFEDGDNVTMSAFDFCHTIIPRLYYKVYSQEVYGMKE